MFIIAETGSIWELHILFYSFFCNSRAILKNAFLKQRKQKSKCLLALAVTSLANE